MQILKQPEATKNKRVYVSAFEASQQQVVAELEKQQGVRYATSHLDAEATVAEAKAKWKREQDVNAAYRLVSAGTLVPECNAGFVNAGKQPILEELVSMPSLTLEDVVKQWIVQNPQAVV